MTRHLVVRCALAGMTMAGMACNLFTAASREATAEPTDPPVDLTGTEVTPTGTSRATEALSPTASETLAPESSHTPLPPPPTSTPVPPTATKTPVPLPDLACSDLTHTGFSVNDDHIFRYTYANLGDAATGGAYRLAFAITDPSGGTGTVFEPGPALKAGESTTGSKVQIFSRAGDYIARITTDSDGDLEELREDNNACELAFTVRAFGLTPVTTPLFP